MSHESVVRGTTQSLQTLYSVIRQRLPSRFDQLGVHTLYHRIGRFLSVKRNKQTINVTHVSLLCSSDSVIIQ
jgi:hypothetical protein